MPCPGTEPDTFWLTERLSNQQSHTGQGSVIILKLPIYVFFFLELRPVLGPADLPDDGGDAQSGAERGLQRLHLLHCR